MNNTAATLNLYSQSISLVFARALGKKNWHCAGYSIESLLPGRIVIQNPCLGKQCWIGGNEIIVLALTLSG